MRKWSYWLRVPCCALVVSMNLAPLSPSNTPAASAQTAMGSPLLRATELADQGLDQELVQFLRPLVDADSLPRADRPTAFNLLGKSYVRLEASASADTMFYLLARSDPAWLPTISGYSDGAELTAALSGYERAHHQKRVILNGPGTLKKPWWKDVKTYIPIAAGTAAYLVTRDKKEPKPHRDDTPNPGGTAAPLPPPPLPPNQ